MAGLIGLGERKSVQLMAARVGGLSYDQLHHFIAEGIWDATPLEQALVAEAGRLVGGPDAILVVDDTALPKKREARRGRDTIRHHARQERQLPDAGLAHARRGEIPVADQLAAVPARGLVRGS